MTSGRPYAQAWTGHWEHRDVLDRSGSFSFSPFIVPKYAHTTHVQYEILL